MTWTVCVQMTRATFEADEECRGTYDSFQSAKECAISAVHQGNYNARVINSKGVEVFNARKSDKK